jgi:hypothetical protein
MLHSAIYRRESDGSQLDNLLNEGGVHYRDLSVPQFQGTKAVRHQLFRLCSLRHQLDD